MCSPDRPPLGSQCHEIPGRGPSAAVAGWATDVREQEAGDAGWKRLVEAESPRRRRLLECPQFARYASGEVLGSDYGSQPILRIHWYEQAPRTQTQVDLPPGKSRRLRWAKGYGNGPGTLFWRGCRWLAATERGRWGKVLRLGSVEMNGLRVRLRRQGSAVGDINTDTQRTHNAHPN